MINKPANVQSISAAKGASEANRALGIVSLAVFLASSTWFSGTAAARSIAVEWDLTPGGIAWLTISVQLGFIFGTFIYSALNLADRFNPRKVFFVSGLLAAAFNIAFGLLASELIAACLLRFLNGVALAGIYPVGMKIVATWFESGLGWRLGVLVGALTLGTSAPYFIQAVGVQVDWRLLVSAASLLALAGSCAVLALTDGPYRKARSSFDGRMILKVFSNRRFRYSAFGYFGHMWELYAFWSLIGFYLSGRFPESVWLWMSVLPLLSFVVIGVGAAGCAGGGWISRSLGERRVALVSLLISGLMCLLSGFAFRLPASLLIIYLLVWGIFVVSDSPQFSALSARYAPGEYTGTALTVQNGVGFAITAVSIEVTQLIATEVGWQWAFVFLAPGPAIGAYFMIRLRRIAAE